MRFRGLDGYITNIATLFLAPRLHSFSVSTVSIVVVVVVVVVFSIGLEEFCSMFCVLVEDGGRDQVCDSDFQLVIMVYAVTALCIFAVTCRRCQIRSL